MTNMYQANTPEEGVKTVNSKKILLDITKYYSYCTSTC